MTLPWRNRQTLALAADLACDVRQYPVDHVARRLYQLTPAQMVNLTLTLAALVDLGAPITVDDWDTEPDWAPKPPQCPLGIEGHRSFRLEAGRAWRCRGCDRDRKRRARRNAATNQRKAAA